MNNNTHAHGTATWKRTVSRNDQDKWSLIYAPTINDECANAMAMAIAITCRRAFLQGARRFVELPEQPDVRLWLIPAALEVGCN